MSFLRMTEGLPYLLRSCMASPRRIEQLNIVLKEEVSRIVDRELEFPEESMVTLTRMVLSKDARYATVFFSVLGASAPEISDVFRKNIYHIQQMLNRTVRMHPVPQIRFLADQAERHREEVEKSLAELKQKGEL